MKRGNTTHLRKYMRKEMGDVAKKYTEAEIQSNELKRIENEENRIENEAERVANEIQRIAKEEIRNEFYDGFNDRLNEVNSQLAYIQNEEVVANRFGLKPGMDMYKIVQELLLRDDVAKVKVLEGDYTLSNKIIIPEGKQLILTGDNGAIYVYSETDISSKLFTKIKPTFNAGYCFELYDKSSLIGGFIDCSPLTSGGGVYLDFSQKCIHAIRINTVLFGGFNWNIDAIKINGDRPSGTSPGYGYYFDINCGISGFRYAVHLVRLDAYTSLTSDSKGLAWINGLNIKGNFMRCQLVRI